MKDNCVSVIVPAFNAAPSLGRCLESILSQDLKTVQIIVINDGSTDNTAEIVGNYKDKILYLEQANQDAAAARNRRLQIATDKYAAQGVEAD